MMRDGRGWVLDLTQSWAATSRFAIDNTAVLAGHQQKPFRVRVLP